MEILLTEASANRFVQNSCSKQFFTKLPERPANELEKDSNTDVSLGSFQKFPEQLFFRNVNGWELPKIHTAFFLEHQWTPLNG